MNTQNTATLRRSGLDSSRGILVRTQPTKWTSRLRRLASFAFRAGLGGSLGVFVWSFGRVVYYRIYAPGIQPYASEILFEIVVLSVPAFLLALITCALTLGLENLIEEKLTLLPCAIATAILSALILLGLIRIWVPLDWEEIKRLAPQGLALGFPVGLLARAKLNLGDRLIYGGQKPVTDIRDLERNLFLFVMGVTGGVALRLVGVIGFMFSVLVLYMIWPDLETHERLVMVYAIYYFGCTAFVSLCLRSRWMVVGAAAFLNTLLLALALFWEPSAGIQSPLPYAFVVLAALWLMFIGGWARPAKTRRLTTSFQEN